MPADKPITLVCLASYFKGVAFMQAAKQLGCQVILIAKESFKDEAWPRESLDEIYFMPDVGKRPDIQYAVSYLARSHDIDHQPVDVLRHAGDHVARRFAQPLRPVAPYQFVVSANAAGRDDDRLRAQCK